ncbi:MAG TPA: hypothetical protein PLB21_08045, partial [Actinomycetota bacterium]|nr:hypothetical protein [Actinomycetota bacterium]
MTEGHERGPLGEGAKRLEHGLGSRRAAVEVPLVGSRVTSTSAQRDSEIAREPGRDVSTPIEGEAVEFGSEALDAPG